MLITGVAESFICARCLHRQQWARSQIKPVGGVPLREFRSTPRRSLKTSQTSPKDEEESHRGNDDEGAMSRRLSELTNESFEHGGRAARKAMDEAGFSEDLKQRLIAKIEDSKFRSENPAAFAQLDMPVRCHASSIFWHFKAD